MRVMRLCVDVRRAMRIYWAKLRVSSLAHLASPDSATVLSPIKDGAHHVHVVGTRMAMHRSHVFSARRGGTGLLRGPIVRCHVSGAYLVDTPQQQEQINVWSVRLVVLVLITKLRYIYLVPQGHTTAIQVKLAVWRARKGNTVQKMDRPYV